MKIAGQVKGGKRIGKKPRNLRKENTNEQVLIKGGGYVMLCYVQFREKMDELGLRERVKQQTHLFFR